MVEPVDMRRGGSKADNAYETIKARIEGGQYGPGHRLVFDQLARELSVSPVPVREAVRRLEAEGYVTFQRNVGATVATVDSDQYVFTMQVLGLLEGAATAMAAPVLSPADLERARELNNQMRESLAQFDPVGFTRLNREFHEVLCRRCPNPQLRSLVEREWSRLDVIRRTTFGIVPGRATRSVLEHEHLVRLIEAGASAGEIERVAREHKLATLRAFQDATAAGAAESGGAFSAGGTAS
ncbi:GntR family transcriptional regulator [Frankia sp. QA3]|uniref:GntR family transcriptional regulator n=1 Tax=Frankia sp. QA3 TaxID=710111 RepID=UPI000269BF8A|nr:GntR family transcriptional regulator [Frankia sp. QA3]EIV92875.1 transcriptional regulator [Frankia sp. QA3]